MESHKSIEDQAAAFLAQRDSGAWTDADQANLARWIEASTAHRVALLRLEASWDDARRLRALSAGLPPGTLPAPGQWRHTPFFDERPRQDSSHTPTHPTPAHELSEGERTVSTLPSEEPRVRNTRRGLWALAASLLLSLGIGAYFLISQRGDEFSTRIGQVASIPLRDGSSVMLNTASKVRVDLTARERRVDLERGEAFFEVAKDPARPFVVEAGSKRVIAVGTKFSVRRSADDVKIAVTEGKVRVEDTATALRVRSDGAAGDAPREDGSAEVFLSAGTIARAAEGDVLVQNTSIPVVEEALSWRRGYLTFHETSLLDAVEEFNRYNAHKIRVEDPKIAAIRISGTFRPTNYEAFVRLLKDGFSIHAKEADDQTTVITD